MGLSFFAQHLSCRRTADHAQTKSNLWLQVWIREWRGVPILRLTSTHAQIQISVFTWRDFPLSQCNDLVVAYHCTLHWRTIHQQQAGHLVLIPTFITSTKLICFISTQEISQSLPFKPWQASLRWWTCQNGSRLEICRFTITAIIMHTNSMLLRQCCSLSRRPSLYCAYTYG